MVRHRPRIMRQRICHLVHHGSPTLSYAALSASPAGAKASFAWSEAPPFPRELGEGRADGAGASSASGEHEAEHQKHAKLLLQKYFGLKSGSLYGRLLLSCPAQRNERQFGTAATTPHAGPHRILQKLCLSLFRLLIALIQPYERCARRTQHQQHAHLTARTTASKWSSPLGCSGLPPPRRHNCSRL